MDYMIFLLFLQFLHAFFYSSYFLQRIHVFCFVLAILWTNICRYISKTFVPSGFTNKKPKLWILPNYWRIPIPPKSFSSWERSHIPLTSWHFWQRIFLLPRSNMLVPLRVNLQPFSFNTAPLTTVTWPSPGHGIATTRAQKIEVFAFKTNSIGVCLPMFRLTLPGNLLRWNQVPSSFGGLKLTQTIWRDQNKRGICYKDQKIKYLLTVWLLNKNHKATRFERFGDFPQKEKLVKVLQSLFGVTDFPAP